MRVHHLSCGTGCPVGAGLVPELTRTIVCHCLLIETDASGLVLVDTGLGLADLSSPAKRLGSSSRLLRFEAEPAAAAVEQIRRLGLDPGAVRHVIPTHLDFDHAGGLPDFPRATVHVLADELEAATARPLRGYDRTRYLPHAWAHGPRWRTYGEAAVEPWFGFAAVRELAGLPPEILLVPLRGHTRGHAGVAVHTPDGWLLHAGDAYFARAELAGGPRSLAHALFRRSIDAEPGIGALNRERLGAFVTGHPEVTVFGGHDPGELPPPR